MANFGFCAARSSFSPSLSRSPARSDRSACQSPSPRKAHCRFLGPNQPAHHRRGRSQKAVINGWAAIVDGNGDESPNAFQSKIPRARCPGGPAALDFLAAGQGGRPHIRQPSSISRVTVLFPFQPPTARPPCRPPAVQNRLESACYMEPTQSSGHVGQARGGLRPICLNGDGNHSMTGKIRRQRYGTC